MKAAISSLTDRMRSILARRDARAFWLRSFLVGVSMLFMWPRLIWIAGRAIARYLRQRGLFDFGQSLVVFFSPLFFWAAPLLVLLTEGGPTGIPHRTAKCWPIATIAFGATTAYLALMAIGNELASGTPLDPVLGAFLVAGVCILCQGALQLDETVAKEADAA